MLQSSARIVSFAVLLFCALSASAQSVRPFVPSTVKPYSVLQSHPDFVATLVLRGISGGRTILFDQDGDLIVLARDKNSILAVFEETSGSGKFTYTTIVNAAGLGLNHGLALRDGYIYASSTDTVYRWPYVSRSRKLITTASQTVITNITPSTMTGGHATRTIVFSKDKQWLYVSLGSKDNVDPADSLRAKVRRFPFAPIANEASRTLPIVYTSGEIWAEGLRNAVALAVDPSGKLWEADNGPDNLSRADLGGYEDNPAEEVNLLDGPVGKKYGYPYCFTAGNTTQPFLQDPIRGTQYAWPGQPNDDNWCRNAANNQPPMATIPSHSAPLNLAFFADTTGQTPALGCGSGNGAFPCTYAGHAFLALHGSWNANTPKGYKVSRLGFDKSTGLPNKNDLQDIIWHRNFQTQCTLSSSSTCFRPAGVTFDAAGTMFAVGQETGDLVRVFYVGGGGNGITISSAMTQADINAIKLVNEASPSLISPSPLPTVASPSPSPKSPSPSPSPSPKSPSPSPSPKSPSPIVTSPSPTNCVDLYRQCGGSAYTGSKCCNTGTCVYVSTWYSQCK